MTELYERMAKHGIPEITITLEDFERDYFTYSIVNLPNNPHLSKQDVILAIQDAISIYLLLQKERGKQPRRW